MVKSSLKPYRSWLVVVAVAVLVLVLLLALSLTSNVQDGLQRSLYPVNHEQTIQAASQEYGMEPALVAAVIHTESEFDPEARSSQNAYGLMQIVPETAQNIGRLSGIEGDYREPRVNIRMGVWYLDYLEERYAGSERLMLAAYNAGEGTVDGWLQDENFDVRQDIPFPETASYVVDVRETRDAYAELYGPNLDRAE
jgi:soluble lytic murein transglycosylase